MGSRGYAYSPICLVDRFPKFNDGYQHGKYIHDMEVEISAYESDIRNLEDEVEVLVGNIEANEHLIFSGSITRAERRALVEENKHMKATILDIHDEIYDIEQNVELLRHKIDNAR